jgi:HPr kinase/phosphorylase
MNIRQMFGDTAVKRNKYLRLIANWSRPAPRRWRA